MKYFKNILVAIFFTLMVNAVSAQPPGDPGGDPDEVPIDGGISLLLAAGALYGAKKVYQKTNA